jgi:hypothetical protein
MNLKLFDALSTRAVVKQTNGHTEVDYAMLATCRVVLDIDAPVRANGAEAPAAQRPRRLGRLFHTVRVALPRESSPIAA